MGHDTDEDKFLAALNAEDDLGAVVRAHIHIESALNDLISLFFVEPKHIDMLKLEFHEKVTLAQACGLRSQFAPPLNALGTLRNNFAHKLDAELGKSEVDSLYKSFDGEDKQVIQTSYQRTKKQFKTKGPKSATDLEPKILFTLIAISMREILFKAQSELSDSADA